MISKTIYTFAFEAGENAYSFTVTSESREAGLLQLRADLAKVIQEINELSTSTH